MADLRRVLVVEDEPAIASVVTLYLEYNGYAVEVAGDVHKALTALARQAADVILLDIALPGREDGLDLCRRLRSQGDWTPVIFVSARDDEIDRVAGLELGADDYVTKPYSPRELVSRVKAVLRRHDRSEVSAVTGEKSAGPVVLQVGQVRLDRERRRVWAGADEVVLTPTELDLLATLMARPGRVFGRGELLAAVWGYPFDDVSRTVDAHVAQLRTKLGDLSPIRTVRGVGYSADDAP